MIIHAAAVYNILSSAFGTTQFSLRAWVDGRLYAEVTENHHIDFVLVTKTFSQFSVNISSIDGRCFQLWYGVLLICELNQFLYLVCSV